jgi:hypothetical protein
VRSPLTPAPRLRCGCGLRRAQESVGALHESTPWEHADTSVYASILGTPPPSPSSSDGALHSAASKLVVQSTATLPYWTTAPFESLRLVRRELAAGSVKRHYWQTLDLIVSPYTRMQPTYVCWRGMVRILALEWCFAFPAVPLP